MTAQRPLSPHLQIYRWPITMVLSIAHRATGIALAAGSLMLVWWLVALATGPEAFAVAQGFAGSFLGILFMLGWTASLFFHLANGIRHLFWDAGYGFEIKTTTTTSWAVIGAAVALTLIAFIAGITAMTGGAGSP